MNKGCRTQVLGLIPAWAGKTASRPRESCSPAAHPRVGGENVAPHKAQVTMRGSSPRGRGKRRDARAVLDHEGLIPAWAGKTPVDPAPEP